jgi:hypothetical protein
MQLLASRGAIIDGPKPGSAVNGCLYNGRKLAAEWLATNGAALDLESAAGVGRLDVVRACFNTAGELLPPATPQQMKDGFAWACEFGRTAVVEFFLDRGIRVDARLRHHGQTGLHWAAWGGHFDTVELLLRRGAAVDAKDEQFDGTPLDWALYARANSSREAGRFYDIVVRLVQAGAVLDPRWYEDDPERRRALAQIQSDPRLAAALRGEPLP